MPWVSSSREVLSHPKPLLLHSTFLTTVCLSEWTKPEDLSADCVAALPKKEKKERVLSDKEKAKAAKRRK